jgi:uncharacterized Zn-binding protein involved in type VI secretion
MGKPAARLGDLTAHGGTVTLGDPTIMMGKMPAAALGGMHVCPMCTGPVPHVGGPITLGSMGVMVGKKPSARISDMATCVGPPSMNALGCFTVLIGEAGSGSDASSAGAAAEAQAAKKKGPKAIGAFPLGEPPGPSESHEILVEFVDSAGKPLNGVRYAIKDPDKQDIIGASTLDGAAMHGGYAKKGDYTLTVQALTDLKWAKTEAGVNESVKFSAKADSFEDGVVADIQIFEDCGPHHRLLEQMKLKVQGEKISGEWMWKKIFLPPGDAESMVEPPTYTFQIVAEGMVAVSGPLKLSDKFTVKVTDGDGDAKKQLDYEITLATGELRTGKLDDTGKATVDKVPPGKHKVRIIDPKKKRKAAPEKQAKAKPSYTGFGDVKEAEKEQKESPSDPKKNPLTPEAKMKVVHYITTFEGGKGDAAYYAMNLDYEFEGRWDLPRHWYSEKTEDGKLKAKPDSCDPNVPYSKYSAHPRHVGLSYGIIQFTQEGPLGELVGKMHEKDSAKFGQIFGDHADEMLSMLGKKGDFQAADEDLLDNQGEPMGTKKVRRKPSVHPVGGHELWEAYWTVRFKEAGQWKPFQECQEELAIQSYMEPCVQKMKSSGMKTISQKSLTFIFDRSVNNGPGKGKSLAEDLAKASDEKAYWKEVVDGLKESVKHRMQKIYDSNEVSWNEKYDL